MVLLLGCTSRLDGEQKQEGAVRIDKLMQGWSWPEITSVSTICYLCGVETLCKLEDHGFSGWASSH